MALDYSAIFGMVGKLVQAVDGLNAYYTSMDTYRDEILSTFGGESRYDLLSDVPGNWESYKANILGMIQQINSKTVQVLTHRDLILEQISIGSGSSLAEVMPLFIQAMIDDSENVEPNTITVGSVTTDATNASVGTLWVDTTLDGVTPPGSGYPAVEAYNGLTSELADDETVVIRCVQDSESGLTEGQEIFTWYGDPAKPSPYHWQDYGTGTAIQIQPLNAQTYIRNGEFEDFTSNVPDNWTLDNGTAGSHVYEETSVVQRGTSALKFTGDGAQATIQISQAFINVSNLVPLKRYALACWVRGTSSTSNGTLTIQLAGTGYTPSSSEKIELNAAALSALSGWTAKIFYINMPREIPDDLEVVIKVTGTLTTAKSVYIDGLAFGTVTYCGGVNVVMLAGNDKFLKGDTFAFTTANDDNGVFQTYFRKALGYQLSSDATPSISDSLAT